MRQPLPTDALRLFLIASLGLGAAGACGGTTLDPDDGSGNEGDGDGGDGDSTSGSGGTTGDGDLGGTSGGTDGGTGGSAISGVEGCTNPQPLLAGQDTGFFRCDEGYVHRTEQKACPSLLPRAAVVEVPDYGLGGMLLQIDECATDADCEGELSYCKLDGGGQALPSRVCAASCVTDTDCGAGNVCVCGPQFGTCAAGTSLPDPGGCNTDADCAADDLCVGFYYPGACGEGHYEFTCTPFALTCEAGDLNCSNYNCGLVEGAISCTPNVVCGRPFLIAQEDRKAVAILRSDWRGVQTCPASSEPSDPERQLAANYFERIALMEHASIAAFARFSLQLLSLGAPAQFLEATHQALVDETKHARLAFSLASRFRGENIGPGPLEISGALHDDTPEAILTTTILEGCIGETIAALEARAALLVCEDPEVKSALEQIAEDESRHAQLAWQVVQWMLTERPELRPHAAAVFESALDAAQKAQVSTASGAPAWGVLSAGALSHVQQDARQKVVRPCALALLSSWEKSSQTSSLSPGSLPPWSSFPTVARS